VCSVRLAGAGLSNFDPREIAMADVVLFHHIQGLTPGVSALADALRGDGHTVHTPDVYEGRTFGTIESGSAYADEVGFETLIQRAQKAVEGLPADLVYAGISMGAMHAEALTLTRPGARGAALLESAVPIAAFAELQEGLEWPADMPFQIHGMDKDPYFAGEGDIDAAREMVANLPAGELFIYPGSVHLFTDSSLASYDAAATALLLVRLREFLARI
jgi:dienelactone hydrolase